MIDLAIISALIIIGLYNVTQEGKLLYFVRCGQDVLFARKREPKRFKWLYYYKEQEEKCWALIFAKPLLNCPICMSSIWGAAAYFLLSGDLSYLHWSAHLKCCAINVLATAGIVKIVQTFIEAFELWMYAIHK